MGEGEGGAGEGGCGGVSVRGFLDQEAGSWVLGYGFCGAQK